MNNPGPSSGAASNDGDEDMTTVASSLNEGPPQSEGTEPELSDRNSGVTSTRSLVGSILHYPVENGRRYCGTGPDAYFMPNDDMEQTRLNIVHSMYLYLLDGRLTLTPLTPKPERILDVGTGTGEWAIGMAEQHPEAEVTGVDLSAIQPNAVPSNVFFEVDDAEQEWTFGTQFDLIHVRNLAGSFRSWDHVYRESFRHLKPGAYLEIIECDHVAPPQNVDPNSHIILFVSAMREASEKAGRFWGIAHMKRERLEAAGFRVVESRLFSVPIGTWPVDPAQKTIGKLWLISMLEGLEAASLRLLTRELDWKPEDVRDLCQKVKVELKEGGLHISTPV
ncbi:MAG: hypothetical protein M1825_000998 [Sarcosagium campestre]|nr:MAG: hypothetical protein M1825_000998 [Sarcosagium campestre]